jgi:hypothetical protein
LKAIAASGQTPHDFLSRHVRGDWGEIDSHDWKANEVALKVGERLLSVYTTIRGVRLYVITEADRSSTCILRPEEY